MNELVDELLAGLRACWENGEDGSHTLDGGRYLQWARWPEGVQAECSDDRFWDEGARLTFRQRRLLARFGFASPTDDIPNYWRRASTPEELPELAAALARCATEVLSEDSELERDLGRSLLRWFGAADLAYPYVPDFAIPALRVLPPETLATTDVDPRELYLFEPAAAKLLADPTEMRFAVSYYGHGVNSYAWTVLLQRPGLRLLAQVGFGGAFGDAQKEAEALAELFGMIRSIDAELPYSIRRDVCVLSSDLRSIRATGWASGRSVDLADWLEGASTAHPLLVLDDLVVRSGAWPERPQGPLHFANRGERMAHEAQVADDWARRYPEAAAGDTIDPVADLALAQAMAPWIDLAQPHAWLPTALDDPNCWWCFGGQTDEIHT